MRRVCCWCEKDLGEKTPIEVEGVTGGACEPCATALLGDIRRETGWAYHLVLSRGCAHLFEEVSRLLRPWPHVKVVVDRRYTTSGEATPPLSPELRKNLAAPPRPYHLVIRRDCAHLYEDLVPLFAGRPYIRVLVDRRNRSRAAPSSNLPTSRTVRQGDPPAWLV
jgi:hypothetical protein